MTPKALSPARPRTVAVLIYGGSLLAVLLMLLRYGFHHSPLASLIGEKAFKYLSQVYVAGRLTEWFVLTVGRRVARSITTFGQHEVIHD
jgi:hypothetical protein